MEWRKVMWPDSHGKHFLGKEWTKHSQNGPNMGYFAIFLSKNHYILLLSHLMIESHDV